MLKLMKTAADKAADKKKNTWQRRNNRKIDSNTTYGSPIPVQARRTENLSHGLDLSK
jgi:hypothetical protein